ncbi:MAG: phasin family protein [Armatimonadota bacterium]|nr:phasin family protein [Armatimonadota bacterium]
MTDIIKKWMAFGLGVAALSADKAREFVDQAVARGEMTRDEAKTMMEDISTRADEEKQSLRNWIYDQVNKALRDAGAADATRVAQLEGRISALERRIERLEGASPTLSSGACEEAPTVISE